MAGARYETDVEILVENETFHTHAAILISLSEFFHSALCIDMLEKSTNSITLDETAYNFRMIFPFLDGKNIRPHDELVDEKNVHIILSLADKYMIQLVIMTCQNFLLKKASPQFSNKQYQLKSQCVPPEWVTLSFPIANGISLMHLLLGRLYNLEKLLELCDLGWLNDSFQPASGDKWNGSSTSIGSRSRMTLHEVLAACVLFQNSSTSLHMKNENEKLLIEMFRLAIRKVYEHAKLLDDSKSAISLSHERLDKLLNDEDVLKSSMPILMPLILERLQVP